MRSLNQFKKIIFVCVITAAAMFFAVPATQTAYADTQAPVKYVDENGTEHQVNSYTVLKNDMTEIGSAEGTWYVVNENVTFEKNLKVKDNAKANLILCEGKKMRCKDNFTVNETSELTIWGQKQTSGELESSGGYFSAYAAIGGAPDHSNGLIEIHSGNVIAHLGGAIFFNRGAAIGAGNGADGGEIRILGGKVHAYTEGAGTGIGGGHKGGSGKIQISGGDVTGHSKAEGAGIGSGDEAGDNAKGEIIITGGKVDDPNTITQLLPKTDHEWGAADYTWMDDNHRVLAKRQCQLEPSHFETEVAQTSSEVIREATCTEAGTTKYTADFANEAFSQQIKEETDIPALGHDWDEWMETTPATEDTAGEEARACSRCTETQTRIIPPKDHRHGLRHIAAKAATCTENGWVEYYVCDRGDHPCGRYYADPEGTQSIDDPFIPALGHNYQVEWEWSDDNTSATLSYVCLNDEADAGTVAAEVRVEETPATCEKAGKKLYVATVANGPGEKALKINAKTGKITVKKKTKKGTYKMNVTVTAAGNGNYNAKV